MGGSEGVEDGELVNDGKGLYLTTDKDYGDFELLVDYKMLPLGDSGDLKIQIDARIGRHKPVGRRQMAQPRPQCPIRHVTLPAGPILH